MCGIVGYTGKKQAAPILLDGLGKLDDLLRADGFWLYYGVEAENFFLIQWYPDEASANAKLAQLEDLEYMKRLLRGGKQ